MNTPIPINYLLPSVLRTMDPDPRKWPIQVFLSEEPTYVEGAPRRGELVGDFRYELLQRTRRVVEVLHVPDHGEPKTDIPRLKVVLDPVVWEDMDTEEDVSIEMAKEAWVYSEHYTEMLFGEVRKMLRASFRPNAV